MPMTKTSGSCPGWCWCGGEKPRAGLYHVVVDILVRHRDGTYLLMRRDPRKILGGLWEASAGGSALRGETPLEAARRELREETGIEAGSFTELGSYVLLPIVKLLGTDELSVSFQSACRSDGLDTFTRVLVRSPKRTAEGTCALGAKAEGELIVSGTAGYIWAEAPWWKTKYFEVRTEDPAVKKRFTADFEADGLRYEIADFLYRIQEYPGREDRLTPAESVCMAGIMEQFLRQREER